MPDERRIEADEQLVRRLLVAQTPRWASLPLERVGSAGVDNAIFRLGDDLNVRMPQSEWSAGHVRKEQRWLPGHAERLPLEIPVPVGRGVPGEGFPWPWSVYRWLDGADAVESPVADEHRAARELAGFIAALHQIPTEDGPRSGLHSGLRGTPLPVRDEPVRHSIATVGGSLDADVALALWESAIRVPAWRRAPVWVHGDLHPGNVLVRDGAIGAVIDWGLLSVGDPALDVMAAWTLLSAEARATFREALPVDDHTWARARGWALCTGVIATAYYGDTNPVLSGFSRRAAEEAMADFVRNG